MSKKHRPTPRTAPVKKSATRFSARELALMFTHLQNVATADTRRSATPIGNAVTPRSHIERRSPADYVDGDAG